MTTASIAQAHYRVALQSRKHAFYADEPEVQGGTDTAPAPDELLEAALASCTAITLRMYADRKQWPVTSINVTVQLNRADGKTFFSRDIRCEGEITEEQRQRLLQIAKACPVSKTLSGPIEINSTLQ